MGTTANKLNKILESKAAIKAAIEAKGVTDVGDVLADYPDKIASIPSGGGTGFTGHADVEGLKAIGWTDEDIEYYQAYGVTWDERDDLYYKVPLNNIELYGILTADNVRDYKDIIVYLPKIDTSNVTDMYGMFYGCTFLRCIPTLDTSNVTDMRNMFYGCISLQCIPILDTSNVTYMYNMFYGCISLRRISTLDTSNVTDMRNMFYNCTSLQYIKELYINKVYDCSSMFGSCHCFRFVKLFGLKVSLDLSSTSLLMKESLLFILYGVPRGNSVTITLSKDCYNKYSIDEDIITALVEQPHVLLASA